MFRVLAVVFAALALAATGAAQDKSVPKDKARLHLSMPGLDGGREFFQEPGWNPGYTARTSFAAQMARDKNYPHAQVTYSELAPSHEWTRTGALDEQELRASFPYFKGRTLIMLSEAAGNSSEDFRTMRFGVDGADCVGFSIVLGGIGRRTESGGGGVIGGYYCGAQGAKLSDAITKAVVVGWKVFDDQRKVIAVPPPPLIEAAKAAAAPQ